MITNYGELKAAIATFINRTDLTDQIPLFISMGETVIYQGMRVEGKNVAVRCADNVKTTFAPLVGEVLLLPEDYRERISLSVGDSVLTHITNQTYYDLPAKSGIPTLFTQVGRNYLLYPEPIEAETGGGSTVTLVAGQTEVYFLSGVTSAAYYISGDYVDNRRLLVGVDYTLDPENFRIVLAETHAAGTAITKLLDEDSLSANDISLALGDGQTVIDMTANLDSTIIYISGIDADGGRIQINDDYTTSGTVLTLNNSYPLGTIVTASFGSSSTDTTTGDAKITYFSDFKGTLINDTDSNPMLDSYPEMYLFAALVKAELFIKNDSRMPSWKGELGSLMLAATDDYKRSPISGQTMKMKTQYKEVKRGIRYSRLA